MHGLRTARAVSYTHLGWGTWRALNWWAEEGGDNKLKVSAINISESLNWKIYSDLDEMCIRDSYNNVLGLRGKLAGTTLYVS